jgi:predicted O-linked N-acetylglucosamine transferase (SPINDLY family)/Tfp pilus assembly protein PilF
MSERLQTWFAEAVAAEGRGEWDPAARLYAAILTEQPSDLRARVRLAAVELARSRPLAAAAHYAAAAELRSDVAALPYNEALALISAQSLDAALAPLERAIAIDPRYLDAHLAHAVTLRALGRSAAVVDAVDAALAVGVDSAALAGEHGLALAATDQHERAIRRFGDSVRQGGDTHEMRFQAGCSELALQNAKAALAAFDGALAGRADWIEAKINRAIALNALGRFDDALAACEALSDPRRGDVLRTSARALQGLRRLDEASERVLRAIAIDRNDHDSWELLTTIYSEANVAGPLLLEVTNEALRTWVGGTPARETTRIRLLSVRVGALYAVLDMDAAEETVDELVSLAPDFPLALGHQAFAHSANLDWEGFEARRERLIRGVQKDEPVTTPFQFIPQCDDPGLQRRCTEYYVRLVYPAQPALASHTEATSDRIRVGYLSADFRDHPVSHLLAATLEAHDRNRFEIFGFSTHLIFEADPTSQRIRAACDHFESVSGVSDEEAARRIRGAGIDILIELNGLTAGERLGISSRRPAPVQVNFLGYPGTTGADFIDYVIADRAVIPVAADGHYTERVVRLPGAFLPPGDPRNPGASPGRATLGLPEEAVVLAAFHSGFKLSPELFAVWMRLLDAEPGAVLWLSKGSERSQARLRARAEAFGIDPNRLVFAERIPSRAEHLARLGEADLLLDTPVYNSHSSALDALGCGIPILTTRGQTFAARVCGSLLDEIGLSEAVAESLEAYEQRGLEWLTTPGRLRELRETVRRAVEAAGLFDAQRHTRRLEQAYATMHARRLNGEVPAAFDVTDPA